MRSLKGPLLGFGAVAAVVLVAWLVLFGTAAPCDALASKMAEAVKDEPADVRKATAEMTKDMSPVLCVGGALRLAFGDRSFIKIVRTDR